MATGGQHDDVREGAEYVYALGEIVCHHSLRDVQHTQGVRLPQERSVSVSGAPRMGEGR
jgi:hypothetical protein